MKLGTVIEATEFNTSYLSRTERRAIKLGFRQGLERGLQLGLQLGRQLAAFAITVKQLEKLLGELPPRLIERIHKLPLESLEQLSEALFDFATLKDLHAWLRIHKANGKKG